MMRGRRSVLQWLLVVALVASLAGLSGCGSSDETAPLVQQTNAVGFGHSVVLKDNGALYAWGLNQHGQVGDNTFVQDNTPVRVKGPDGVGFLTNVVGIGAGFYHNLAVKSDGSVWAWGQNTWGMIGDNTTTDRPAPVQVNSPSGVGFLTGVREVSSGGDSASFAIKNDGTLFAWGNNISGMLGDNTSTDRFLPVQVLGPGGAGFLTGVARVAVSGTATHAIRGGGAVWSWGSNANGQLGDNTGLTSFLPVQVTGPGGVGTLGGVTALAGGFNHVIALKSDGTVWTWGLNSSGQLGDNTTTSRPAPVQVKGPDGVGVLSNVIAVAGGRAHSLALKSDGTLWAWGLNTSGQLGDNTTTARSAPVQVKGAGGAGFLTGVAKLFGGGSDNDHNLVKKSDGTYWAWGRNDTAQLASTPGVNQAAPVQVTLP